MCLLISHPADTSFDAEDIKDFYSRNSDGIGVMYAEDNTLYSRKLLPNKPDEAVAFYNEHCVGRECVIHFRMQTHGHIDLTNCHPYPVLTGDTEMPIYMAHNGILSTGNNADKSKSDTWHFIEDYLKPILAPRPELAFEPAFIALLEEAIGSGNKFILMNHLGEQAIVNEHVFVEYKGAKLSNTYAWTSSKGGFNVGTKGGKYRSPYAGFDYDDEWDNYGQVVTYPATQYTTGRPTTVTFWEALRQRNLMDAYCEIKYQMVSDCIDVTPKGDWEDFIGEIKAGYLSNEDVIELVGDRKVSDYINGRYIPDSMKDLYDPDELAAIQEAQKDEAEVEDATLTPVDQYIAAGAALVPLHLHGEFYD